MAEDHQQDAISLRDYFETLLDERQKAAAGAHQAISDHVNERLTHLQAIGTTQLEALRREVEITNAASAAAISKAETSTEKRFESVNEFRAQLTDAISRFMPREVADAQFEELRRSMADLTEKVGKLV